LRLHRVTHTKRLTERAYEGHGPLRTRTCGRGLLRYPFVSPLAATPEPEHVCPFDPAKKWFRAPEKRRLGEGPRSVRRRLGGRLRRIEREACRSSPIIHLNDRPLWCSDPSPRLTHRSAWKGHSANFFLRGFSEVRCTWFSEAHFALCFPVQLHFVTGIVTLERRLWCRLVS
jgi:hypothetical protein